MESKKVVQNNFIVYVSPLNNIYSFDNNYSDSVNQFDNFLKIVSEFPSFEDGRKSLSNIEEIKKITSNPEFSEYLKKRIQIIPYVYKEFLTLNRDRGIKIKLFTKDKKDIEIIDFLSNFLELDGFIDQGSVLFDNIINERENQSPMIISEKMEDLLFIHNSKLRSNCFTVFNFLIFNDTDEYLKLQEENILMLKDSLKNEGSNSNSHYPDLIIESLRQANLFIDFIENRIDKSTPAEIKQEFSSNAIRVVYIFDSKSSAKNYRKRELATSNHKIHYTPFMSKKFGLDEKLSIYKSFQVFLQRCPYLYFSDKNFCLNLQSILTNYHKDKLLIHHMDIIEICFHRYKVYTFIKDFVNEVSKEINEEYGINLSVPYSFSLSIEDPELASSKEEKVEEIKNKIKKDIMERSKDINYPLVIKPDLCSDHEMFLILNEEGLSNFINVENLQNRIKTKNFICQKFVSHGGLMFKNYYINNKSLSIIRPSLPDLEGETLKLKHFSDGCFKFHNEFLYKKEDPSFWEGVAQAVAQEKSDKADNLKSKINYKSLDKISKIFASRKGISLFGLDYLFDEETNTYYLLEINYFPSYRELGSNLPKEFEEHIIDRYQNFNKLK